MKFLFQKSRIDQHFLLVYRSEDYSFDVEPLNERGISSIMINELQLEIDDDARIIYVWGYCPLIKYDEIDAFPQMYHSGSLIALLDSPPVPGISYRLNEDKRWSVYINKKKGWVCIGDPKMDDKQLIEFAPDCIATMDGLEIIAVWLHPKELTGVF
jgi:hypothetical protein